MEEPLARSDWNPSGRGRRRFVRIVVMVLIGAAVIPPFVGYQLKRLPWQQLAEEVLKGAPGMERLDLRIRPVGVVSPPSFGFSYETHADAGETLGHFSTRLRSLGFRGGEDGWKRDPLDRHVYFHSVKGQLACNITWRSAGPTCNTFGYGRRTCEPSFNVAFGDCSSTSKEPPSAYERHVVGLVVFVVFEAAMAYAMASAWFSGMLGQ